MSPPVHLSENVLFRVLSMACLLLLACSTAWAERVSQVTLLHFNDIYEIAPQQETGGFAPLMTLIEQERHQHPQTLLTFGGDLLSPSVVSYLSKGKEVVSLCNALGIDLAVLGNHEFDFGLPVLEKRLAESHFKWLASNVRGADGQLLPGTILTATRELDGVTFGFIGLLTPSTSSLASLGSAVSLQDPVTVARELIPQLKQQGAEVIVALTHQTQAEDETLAREVKGLHIILGGHDHDLAVREIGKTLIVKAASEGHYLATLDLTVLRPDPGEKGKVRIIPNVHLLSTFRVPAQSTVQAMVKAVEEGMQGDLGRVVGQTSTELDSQESTVRARESSMGNLFADAIRAETKADLVIFNGGSLRGNRIYPAGSPLTYGDILKESPFGNTVVLLEVSEKMVWQALEHSVAQVGQGTGRFPQVAGLSFTYDPRRPEGNRILDISLGDRPEHKVHLDRLGTRLYRLGTNDYVARGGDGYSMLAAAKTLISAEAGKPLSTVVMDFLGQQGAVAYQQEGRIIEVRP
ncbi:MAG: bifunctional metallophosphatase/5'-nucleotidase [Magnetococcales bacterium]|nr:bifunctional metallophosphatase/5'-nucleotidase [Magnetococcales bacterium]